VLCLDADGRSNFHKPLFRRDWPYFAFDVLSIDGEDLQDRPLIERKRRLRGIMPRIDSRLLYVDHLHARGSTLFHAACKRDLEEIIGTWRNGRDETDEISTCRVKIRNPTYLQMTGRRELFEARRDPRQERRRDWRRPEPRVAPA
jgi:hypothetical protein